MILVSGVADLLKRFWFVSLLVSSFCFEDFYNPATLLFTEANTLSCFCVCPGQGESLLLCVHSLTPLQPVLRCLLLMASVYAVKKTSQRLKAHKELSPYTLLIAQPFPIKERMCAILQACLLVNG